MLFFVSFPDILWCGMLIKHNYLFARLLQAICVYPTQTRTYHRSRTAKLCNPWQGVNRELSLKLRSLQLYEFVCIYIYTHLPNFRCIPCDKTSNVFQWRLSPTGGRSYPSEFSLVWDFAEYRAMQDKIAVSFDMDHRDMGQTPAPSLGSPNLLDEGA